MEWAIAAASRGLAFASDRLPGAAPGAAQTFVEPADPQALPDALEAALAGHGGPVLLVAPDVPGLNRGLAVAALDDLARGCLAALAPATDGRAYLFALADARRGLLDLAASRPGRRELSGVATLSEGDSPAIGLLRSERRLVTAHDARAMAVDPLAPPDLAPLVQPIRRDRAR